MLFVAAVSYKSWLLLICELGRWRGSKRPGVANLLRLPGKDSHFANTTLLNLAEACIANMLLSQSKTTSSSRVYRTLSGDSEIRLAILLPSNKFEAPIECRLEHAVIGSCTPYEALSYVWGEPHFTESITLDGQNFMITPRLATALRYLRLQAKERVLWIDAICINQEDLAERQEQVGHMRNIYSSCSSDILWLGPGSDDYRRGMKAVRRLAALTRKQEESGAGWVNVRSCENVVQTQLLIGKLLRHNAVWKRVWIMQEISVSPNVILTNGHDTMDWSLVEKVAHGGVSYTDAFHGPFSHSLGISGEWVEMFSTAKLVTNQREITAKILRGKDSLLDVLARFKHTEATDPRDKIYALLGLVKDPIGVKADYTKSTVETYTSVTMALFNAAANLDVLCQCPWARQHSNLYLPPLEGLPSWAPDFRTSQDGKFLFAQRGIYSAGRLHCPVPCTVQGTTLWLKGYSLGHLQASKGRHAPVTEERPGYKHYLLLRDWAYENLKTDNSGKITQNKYLTGEDQLQAFWRTLVGDCKGYPQQRLTSDDIIRHQSLVQNLVDQPFESVLSKFTRVIYTTRTLKSLIESNDWRFYTSDNGLFVLAQPVASEGDIIAILHGAKTAMVLRPTGKREDGKETYTFVCGAYVHGFMDGEVYEAGDEYEEKVFLIV
jgi:hypothetical protein